MDSLTHILIGATIGLAMCKQPLNRKLAAFTGALACTTPDFDVFIFSRSNPLIQELVHRSFSHSLLLIPVGALLVTVLILLLFKSSRPFWQRIFLISLLAYASHAPLDACTSYGTQLLWPFTHERFSFDIISIVDPIFTGILLVGLIVTSYKKSRRVAAITLILACVYLCFCIFQHGRALNTLKKTAPASATHLRVLPELGSQYTWDGLYQAEGAIYISTIKTPLFKSAQIQILGTLPVFQKQNLPQNVLDQPELENAISTFQWFSQGYSALVNTNPLTFVDLRYLIKGKTLRAQWGIVLVNSNSNGQIDKIRKIQLNLSQDK